LDAAVFPTEAGYNYRIGQAVMRFAGERLRAEMGEEGEKGGQGEIIGDLYLRQIFEFRRSMQT
jgi:hypothetical protein